MSDAPGRIKQLERLLRLCERELALLAYELHDGPVQHLVAALMHLESAIARLVEESTEVPPALRQGCDLVRAAVQNVRQILQGIRPGALEAGGLGGAVRELVAMYSGQGLQIQLQLALSGDRFLPSLEAAAYRIVQEALWNVQQHSGTQQADVTVRQLEQQLEVVIRDQGQGFDPNKVPTDRLGLRGIRERAALLDGTASIESAPGKGTSVHVLLPLEDPLLSDER